MPLFKKIENKLSFNHSGNVKFKEFWVMEEGGIPLCHKASENVKKTIDQNIITSFFAVFQNMLKSQSNEELENIKFKNSKLIISDAGVQFNLYFMARVDQKYKDSTVRKELERIGENFIVEHWDDINNGTGNVSVYESFQDRLKSYF